MKRLSQMNATELLHIAQMKLPVAWELQVRYAPYRFVWDYDSDSDNWRHQVEGGSIEDLLRSGLADIVAGCFDGDYTKIGSISEELTSRERLAVSPAFMTMPVRTSPWESEPDDLLLWRPFTGIHVPEKGSVVLLVGDGESFYAGTTTVKQVYLDEHDHTGIELAPLSFLIQDVAAPSRDLRGAVRWVKDEAEQAAEKQAALALLRRRGWEALR